MGRPNTPRDLLDNWIDDTMADAGLDMMFKSPQKIYGDKQDAIALYSTEGEVWRIEVTKAPPMTSEEALAEIEEINRKIAEMDKRRARVE